jgi:DNA repair exonuclease SbcCD nuclease subunit
MKVAILADTHAGCRNDHPTFDAVARRFFTEQFFPYIDKHKIKQVLHLGDVFDRRTNINFQTLKSFREYFLNPVVERDLKIKIIPGNHDVFHKNTNALNSLDELLLHYSDNIEILHDPDTTVIGGISVATIPWICEENEEGVKEFIATTKAKICFGHLEVEGFEMFKGVEHHGGLNIDTFAKFDAVYSGHFHHKNSDKNMHYLGTTYEQCWSDYDDPKGFHIFDTSDMSMTFIENPETTHVKLYYDDSEAIPDPKKFAGKIVKMIVVKKTDFKQYDAFVDALYKHGIAELKILEDMRAFEEDSTDDTIVVDDTATLLDRFVDEIDVEAGVDKDRLKTVLKGIFIEAQAIEV